MSHKMKRLTAALLVAAICMVQFTGCSLEEDRSAIEVVPMEPEEVVSWSPSYIGGKDVMPIAGFYALKTTDWSSDGNNFDERITDEFVKKVAESGINISFCTGIDWETTSEEVRKALELCDKYGIAYFMTDSAVTDLTGADGTDEINLKYLAEQIAEYSDYPAFAGIYVIDEPNTPYYEAQAGDKNISKYVKLIEALKELNVENASYIYPLYDSDDELKRENYLKYIDEFCESFKPNFLGYDNYPFDSLAFEQPLKLDNYFWNLSVIREAAEKNHIPFGVAVQAGGQWNDSKAYFDSVEYFPNEGQFYWNINTYLAAGAKVIEYFPIVQPTHFAYAESTEWDFERNSFFGAAGNINQWYNYAKNINKHIAAIDDVLMNSVNKGVIITGEEAKKDLSATNFVIEEGRFQELMSVEGDAMVGCFNYNGKTALYVMNYSMEYAQKIKLELNKEHKMKMVQNAEASYVKAENLTLDLAAGEGVLLVIE